MGSSYLSIKNNKNNREIREKNKEIWTKQREITNIKVK
jgi:hypothetical protein